MSDHFILDGGAPGLTATAPKLEHPVHWVDSDAQLAELCAQWQQLPMIAVDTEFMRSQTYYPKPALVQVNDGSGNYLIDPLAIQNFAPLIELVTDRSVTKVLHSCSEDLEVFQTLLNCAPQNIFDTQMAAALVGYGFSTGYANLVQKVLNVDLPKGETRSDWLQRPLSQAQRLYAAIDVEYLLVVAEKLRRQLLDLERLSWLEEDAGQLGQALPNNQNPETFYLRIKSAWKLKVNQLAVLQALAAWREQVAQRRDVPRNRVIKEHVLLSLAQDQPQHLGELRKYEGMTERMIRSDGESVIGIIEETLARDESSWPELLPRPLPPGLTALQKSLKAEVTALAVQLQLAPEALMRKKDYENLVRHAAKCVARGEPAVVTPDLQGWRAQVVGPCLLRVLQQHFTGADNPDSRDENGGEASED